LLQRQITSWPTVLVVWHAVCGGNRVSKEVTMDRERHTREEDYTYLYRHLPARPLRYVKDRHGIGWLCDDDVDEYGNLRQQGCWRCDEMAFPTGGR
jgi:hypothetical protein